MWQVIGQPRATRLLTRSIETGQLSHAYLFVGPCHVGKSTLALNLAQAVNCQASDRPCGQCVSCRRIAAGKHVDVQIISAGSEAKRDIAIKQIGYMQMDASLPPYEGRCKVFIFDRAETLSREAANRLLKTLEEPLPRVLMILLTAREKDVLPTIISRCQRVELRPLPVALLKELLTKEFAVGQEKADLLARASGGCLGWALRALQDKGLTETRGQRLSTLIDMGRANAMQRFAYAAELATQFSKERGEVEEFLELWLGWWHDLLLIQGGNEGLITNIDHQPTLIQQAKALSMKHVTDFIHRRQEVTRQLEQNASPRLVFDMLMLSMP